MAWVRSNHFLASLALAAFALACACSDDDGAATSPDAAALGPDAAPADAAPPSDAPAGDLLELLNAIPGLHAVEDTTTMIADGYRLFDSTTTSRSTTPTPKASTSPSA
jgi:hypothetical protein